MDSLYAGYKKQTPITSERNTIENKSFVSGQAGLNKLLNQGSSSIRNPSGDRGDGTITPSESFPIGSPNGIRGKPGSNSKWSNMLNNQA
jgi:hypothetical protein